VCGNGHHVGIGQAKLAGTLRTVGEQQAARLAHGYADPAKGLDDAGLVVDLLHRDQALATYGINIDTALRIHRYPIRPLSLPQDRFVFHGRQGDERLYRT
jgi:hypothetical protein